MALMGQREYARHRNCALRAVQKAIESKRIQTVLVGNRAMIDSAQADQDWQLNTDPAKQSMLTPPAGPLPVPSVGGEGVQQDLLGTDAPEGEGAAPKVEAPDPFRVVRTSREQLALQREEYEFAQQRGRVLVLSEGIRMAFTAFRSLRDEVMNVPVRIKDQLSVMTDPLAIEQLIEDALGEVFGKFDPEKVLADSDDDEDPDD